MNLPTWITVSRLFAVPAILYLLNEPTSPDKRWIALGFFLVAACTDWLDGYLARRLNQVTELGKFLDPLVDKMLVLGPLLALIALRNVPVPAWGVCIILFRELAIAGWRVNQSTVSGANQWGKLKTFSQIVAVGLLIAPLDSGWYIPVLTVFWVAVALTVISGWVYIRPRKN
jgi:CDP-diacylglycerol---glycerol-3-phosphate 3-phosphatidyltransferase